MNTKKIVSLVLALVIVASVTVFAASTGLLTQNSESDQTVATHNFDNTYKKLIEENKLNIAFMGGSITQGVCSSSDEHTWPYIVTEWFKEKFPDAAENIVGNNTGIGSTGSVFGKYRVVQDFKLGTDEQPDLVFLEFAINDRYDGTLEAAVKENMNSILSSIYKYNPKAEVMILLTTDKARFEEDSNVQQAHEDFAAAYGLPVLDIGETLYGEINELWEASGEETIDNAWYTYFADSVHPRDLGYTKYASYITYYLDCVFSAKTKVASEYVDSYKPADADTVFGAALENPHYVTLAGQTAPEGFSINGDGMIYTSTAGSSFTVQFEGTSLAIWTQFETTAGSLSVKIDDSDEEINCYLAANNPYPTIRLIKDGLDEGTHTATFTVNATSAGSSIKISRFCVAGSNKDSTVSIVE